MRASMSSSASRSLTSSAQRSRQRSSISVRFQSRTFGPKPFSSTARMVSMTWAWGLGRPSSAMSQCTLRSAIMPRSTNSRLHEVAGEFDALRLSHLARNGELDLAGELGVLPDLERLDLVPQPFAVAPRLRRILRQHHLGMDDAALVGEVVAALKPLVVQPRGRAVGGGRHRAGAGLAADDLDVKMIDRHRDQIIWHGEAHVGTTYKRALPRKILGRDYRRLSPSRRPYSIVPGAQLSSLHQHLMETTMRKPRDFDAELKSLEDKARDLKAARCSSSANWSSQPGPTRSMPTNWPAR